VTTSRIVENLAVFDFALTDAEVATIDALEANWRIGAWSEQSAHPHYPFK